MTRFKILIAFVIGLPLLHFRAPRASPGEGTARQNANGLPYAEIRVLDAETGRGIPLAELVTVNQLRFVTDNAGRVAFHEPDLLDREVFFTIRSHGYEVKKDGFGFAGKKIIPSVGKVVEIKMQRRNIAERLCRLTGEGRYRDTRLLGNELPRGNSTNPGLVAGQDSVQAVPFKDSVYWFWGDTARMSYPLGLFRVAGAKTPFPAGKFDPARDIAFDYFVDKTGFAPELASRDFFESVFDKLSSNGQLVMNLAGDKRRYRGLLSEVMEVFNSRVITLQVRGDGNTVMMAFKVRIFKPNWRRLHTQAKRLKERYGLDFPDYLEKIEQAMQQR